MSDGGSKMNHIYKVVWSKVKNCYVVVSEIAKSNGKEHTSHSHAKKDTGGGIYPAIGPGPELRPAVVQPDRPGR